MYCPNTPMSHQSVEIMISYENLYSDPAETLSHLLTQEFDIQKTPLPLPLPYLQKHSWGCLGIIFIWVHKVPVHQESILHQIFLKREGSGSTVPVFKSWYRHLAV